MGRRKKDTGETYEERIARLDRSFELASKNIHRKEVTFDTDNYVVMANNMILHSASNLTLNEVKLLRFFIMQTEKGDKELFQFTVDVPKLAESLEISPKVLYRQLDGMTEHLMKEVITIGSKKDDHWIKFHWVDICEYDKGKLTVKLSDELKPFLIGLRGSFTRYRLSEIVGLNSMYAIRIYEVLNGYMNENNRPHADVSIEVSISIEELRRITDTTDKFERYSSFKTKVIDTALKEINQKSIYHVTVTPYKSNRAVVGYDFLIESQVGYIHRTQDEQKKIVLQNDTDQLEGQKDIFDYQDTDGSFKIY